ncbi:MAG TPA: heme o synthase [Candidatus Limnocylindrales bacterium]|nr:heme o synthase [Candidatus Limnocylindrales bacterium]
MAVQALRVAPQPVPLGRRVRAYLALTKPRIIELLLVTTVPAMILATRWAAPVPVVDFVGLVVATLVGGTLAAGSANALNCVIDRDIDAVMQRTRKRPLPASVVDPTHALAFGLLLGALAVVELAVLVNPLAAGLSLLANAFYVLVYTRLLKRTTTQNIVIGGAAGALPPIIGWAAVTGTVGLPALLLFLIVFYWTPPHFWALSIPLTRDYAAAHVPMLPVVRGLAETSRQIVLYTILLLTLTAVLVPVASMGLVYVAGSIVFGGRFLAATIGLWRSGDDGGPQAMRVYRASIGYLTGVFAVVALDVVLPLHVVLPLR